jgi:hypothetical protein
MNANHNEVQSMANENPMGAPWRVHAEYTTPQNDGMAGHDIGPPGIAAATVIRSRYETDAEFSERCRLIAESVNACATPQSRAESLVQWLADATPREIEAMQDELREISRNLAMHSQARHVAGYLYTAFTNGKFNR